MENATSSQIRLAVSEDAEAVAWVLSQAFVEYEALYTPKALAATTPSSEQIRQRLAEGPTWVAFQNAATIGTISAVLKGQGVYVRSMGILPAGRGQGLGQQLLQAVEAFAREQRAAYLFLSTTPFLARAIRLYEQFGFQRNDDGPHDLLGTPLFTMVKPLADLHL
jgi:ribosomal protein S18 acetylase RimI-like enzyme